MVTKRWTMAKFDPTAEGAVPFDPIAEGAISISDETGRQKNGFLAGLLKGTKQGAEGLKQLLGGAVEEAAIPGQQLDNLLTQSIRKILPDAPLTPIKSTQFLSPSEEQTLSTKIGRIGGAIAEGATAEPLAALGEAYKIPRLLSMIGQGAALGALTSPTARAKGALIGGGLGGLGEGIVAGIKKTPGILAKIFPGYSAEGAELTPESAAQEFQSAPQNVNLPLGDLVRNPKLQRIYEKLGAIPFSGVNKPYDELSDLLQSQKESILHTNAPSIADSNDAVYNALNDSYQNARNNRQNAYEALANYAKNNDIPFDDSAYNSALKNSLDDLKSKMKTPGGKEVWGNIYNILKTYKLKPPKSNIILPPNISIPKPISNIDKFENAIQIDQNLNHQLRQLDSPDARKFKRYMVMLKNGIMNSMEDSAKGAGKKFLDLLNHAKDMKKQEVVHEMLDKRTQTPFYKIYSREADPGTIINQYLKPSTGGKDYSSLLENVLNKVPDETREIIASHYLAPKYEGDEVSLGDLYKKLKNLNSKQKELLFKDKKPFVDQLTSILERFPKAKNASFVPKTGWEGGKGSLAVGSGLGGIGLGAMAGHPVLGAMLAPGIFGGARGLGSVLRSKALQDAYIRSLQNLERGAPTSYNYLGAPIRAMGVGEENNGS